MVWRKNGAKPEEASKKKAIGTAFITASTITFFLTVALSDGSGSALDKLMSYGGLSASALQFIEGARLFYLSKSARRDW
ncbi:MAG: hypothetical protein KGH61_00525 [Candidatus Micrarchaeota archaeon]|nr:hypothetical protein [Candidatus Micrarchaeota archaeon]MDE1847420.1 hypothetical protein [Candidatus Micrarchaeota archaeon]MDE1864085.1 hypothetical protein [Candidatus Micrarchaeota archaeon]